MGRGSREIRTFYLGKSIGTIYLIVYAKRRAEPWSCAGSRLGARFGPTRHVNCVRRFTLMKVLASREPRPTNRKTITSSKSSIGAVCPCRS